MTSITSTLSEMDVQLVEVSAAAVEITESGDKPSLGVPLPIISIDSDVFWECCNVMTDDDNGCGLSANRKNA